MLLLSTVLRSKKPSTLTMSEDDLQRAERDYKWLLVSLGVVAFGAFTLGVGTSAIHAIFPVIEKKVDTVKTVTVEKQKQQYTYYINGYMVPSDLLEHCTSDEKASALKTLEGKKIEFVFNTRISTRLLELNQLPHHTPIELCM